MSAVRDSVWSEQDTTPDAIEGALRELLAERHAEHGGFAPARVLNMVAFVERQYSGEIANRLRGVGRYHASRLVVLSYHPSQRSLDARVTVASEGDPQPGELALLRETVVVQVGAQHLNDLLTIVDPLLVSDMPTLMWWPHGHPQTLEALISLAQAVLLDSIDEPAAGAAIDRACELSRELYVVDLAWLRSTPWRERIAATFDPVPMRAELGQITSVTVTHHPASAVPALLLLGWLSSRLAWQAMPLAGDGALHGSASGPRGEIALRLRPAPALQVPGLQGLEIQTASGRLVRLDRGRGGLCAHRRDPDGRTHTWTVLGASRGEAGILGEGIRQALLRDPTYIPALTAARAMLPTDRPRQPKGAAQ
ncbi:MAG TPA: glucose-6-phosphate dehydrogenase assembly protein OpcA [Solirubrobacteraceae bacterium]|jgi:glucose-6-phosphate dehydrogenase assembly protein OpcA